MSLCGTDTARSGSPRGVEVDSSVIAITIDNDPLKTTHRDQSDAYQLGLVLRATPLDSIRLVSQAGELMPQESTLFYPKVATGLVMNPLDGISGIGERTPFPRIT